MRGKRISTLAGMAVAATMLFAAPALAAFGDNFGFAEINTGEPGVPDALPFSGTNPETGQLEAYTKAIWAGTCDLSSDSTTSGGVGAHNGGGDAPPIRAHCLDLGTSSVADVQDATNGRLWPVGGEPKWRLSPVSQAGAHPDASATFLFTRKGGFPEGAVKNIIVKLPPGVVGNPEAIAKCPAIFAQAVPPACEGATQSGIVTLIWGEGFSLGIQQIGGGPFDFETKPVYLMEARDTVTAEFILANTGGSGYFNIPITARGRTNSDYGVDTLALLVPDFAGLVGQAFTFWGRAVGGGARQVPRRRVQHTFLQLQQRRSPSRRLPGCEPGVL